MYVDHRIWVKGHSSLEMDVYYCIEGLLESMKTAIILIVCPASAVDDKADVLWISPIVTYCIRNAMMTSVRIGGKRNNLYSLTLSIENLIQLADVGGSSPERGEEEDFKQPGGYNHFYMNGPYNKNCRNEDKLLYELFSTLNFSQWVESADTQLLQTLSREEAIFQKYINVVQCGYEYLVLLAHNNHSRRDDEGKQRRQKNNKCDHFSYIIPEVLIKSPIDWDKPFDTTVEYTIKKKKRRTSELCLLCSFSKYLNRDSRYKDVVKIAPPFCYLLINN